MPESPAEIMRKLKEDLLSMLEAGYTIEIVDFASLITSICFDLETANVTEERRDALLLKLYRDIYPEFAIHLPRVGTYIYRENWFLRARVSWRSGTYLGWAFYKVSGVVSDSLYRPLALVGCTILFFAGIYWLLGSGFDWDDNAITPCFPQCLYFSTVVLTTLGFGDIHPLIIGPWWVLLPVGLEAVSGVFLLGIIINFIGAKMKI